MFQIMREYNLYEPLYLPPKMRPYSVLVVLFNLQKVEYWDVVSNYLNENYRITNREIRKITGIKDTLKACRLLKSWVDKGLLEQVGGRAKKVVYYRKPGIEHPLGLFSIVDENKIEK